MLTKKDFKAVAEIINKHTIEHVSYPGDEIVKHGFTNELADYFATQNPRFDRERFMQTCGLTE